MFVSVTFSAMVWSCCSGRANCSWLMVRSNSLCAVWLAQALLLSQPFHAYTVAAVAFHSCLWPFGVYTKTMHWNCMMIAKAGKSLQTKACEGCDANKTSRSCLVCMLVSQAWMPGFGFTASSPFFIAVVCQWHGKGSRHLNVGAMPLLSLFHAVGIESYSTSLTCINCFLTLLLCTCVFAALWGMA